MRKRKVLAGYGFLFIVMIAFVAVQIAHSEHFVGYASFAPVEEQVVASDQGDVILSFGEPFVLGRGTGKNVDLFIDYRGQIPLISCSISDAPLSLIRISSSQRVSLHSGDRVILPVSIQVPSDFTLNSRNLSLLFSCENYQREYVFPFSIFDDVSASSASPITGFTVGEETRSRLSLFGFVVMGILIVVFVARLFHKRDTQNYVSLDRPRRTLIPLELS